MIILEAPVSNKRNSSHYSHTLVNTISSSTSQKGVTSAVKSYCCAVYESFNAKLKNVKKSKNCGRAQEPSRPRGAPARIFRFFGMFNFAPKDFLAALRRELNYALLTIYLYFVDDDM